jgi:hypothetical protein
VKLPEFKMEVLIEIVLIGMLAATLFHALRLERALGVLKRDRAALEELVVGFNSSTRQAEQGIEKLRSSTDGAGRQLAKQIDVAQALRDDLVFLADRGERLADRLDGSVRQARLAAPEPVTPVSPIHAPALELVHDNDRPARPAISRFAAEAPPAPPGPPAEEQGERLRSQAERDLLKALRMAR